MSNIDILIILQARFSSTRLPGKVLKKVLSKPIILHQIDRIKRCKNNYQLVVATSTENSDDFLASELEKNNIDCYRGSLNDVLGRFYSAAKKYKPKHIIRLTGDCPLIDPEIIDKVVDAHIQHAVHYTSNVSPPSYPDGLDVEVMRYSALEKAYNSAKSISDREHVTLYIRENPELFSSFNVSCEKDYSSLRWTVDEKQDLEFVKNIYEGLYENQPNFGFYEILEFLKKKPELEKINASFTRNSALDNSI